MTKLCAGLLLLLAPSVSYAQVERGTVELTTVTGFTFNKQTLSDPAGGAGSFELNVTNTIAGVDLGFFLTPRVAIGPFLTHVSFKMESPGGGDPFKTSAAVVGGQIKLRFNTGRTGFFVQGGGGVTRTKLESGGVEAFGHQGFYYLAGGGISFWLNDFATIDGGVRYQGSRYNDDDSFDLDAAGILAGLSFSIFIK